jgi:ABC-2 type transport system ATP-binding protein
VTAAIEIAGLTKAYPTTRALDGLDLTVSEGSVFGFLGPNGAGKTTTLRILTGLARPTAGSARVLGKDAVGASSAVRAEIGFLPDVPGFYPWMDAREFLAFAGRLFGLSGRALDQRIDVLLDLAGLADVDTRVGGYSRGMKQRLGVAQALINSPRLLMLDEPTSALDPMGRRDVLEMIGALKGRTTVFFSTHILADVERVCDDVAILDKGRVVRQASIAELKGERVASRISVRVTRDAERLRELLAGQVWAAETWLEESRVLFVPSDVERARGDLPRLLAEGGFSLVEVVEEEPTLEDVFVELVGGGE